MERTEQRASILGLIHEFEQEHQSCIEALGGMDPFRTGRYEMPPGTPEDVWDAGSRAASFAAQLRGMLERLDK